MRRLPITGADIRVYTNEANRRRAKTQLDNRYCHVVSYLDSQGPALMVSHMVSALCDCLHGKD